MNQEVLSQLNKGNARLLQLSANQCDRQASETVKQRETQRQYASERDTDASGEDHYSMQHSLQLKMTRFHDHFTHSPKI